MQGAVPPLPYPAGHMRAEGSGEFLIDAPNAREFYLDENFTSDLLSRAHANGTSARG